MLDIIRGRARFYREIVLKSDLRIGLFTFAAIAQVLERELGRSVELGTMRSLRRPRHNEILDQMVEAF